jgi:DMSO/TMAO reductase YedYZ molybdopterin-dependent catalytic subunit
MAAIDKSNLNVPHGSKISRRKLLKVGVAVAVGLAGISVAGCTSSSPAPGELTQYSGKQLTPASGFETQTISSVPQMDSSSYSLTISGLVNQQKTYAYADLLNLPSVQRVVTLNCVEGWNATALWKGVSLGSLLADAGVMSTAKTVIFQSQDGDSTSFTIDDVNGNDFMIALNINDIPLTADRGYPTRLVADTKWGYKWIKWITSIQLSDQNYTGYWEKNGYSNVGNLNQSFLS